MVRWRIAVTVLAVVAIAGCGSFQAANRPEAPPAAAGRPATPAASSSPSSPPSLSSSPVAPPTISTADSRYGQIVVDAVGRTLYLFDAEPGPQPRCYGACATAWPPLLSAGEPVVGSKLAAGLLGTAPRTDGTRQVTYNSHPLYYYAGERAPGEILCQAVFEFGGGWFVLDAQGNRVGKA